MPRALSPFAVEPGLLPALSLQAQLTDATHHHQQRRAVGEVLGPVGALLLTPGAGAWQHNVAAFLRLLETPLRSRNFYNDPAPLAAADVLASGRTPSTYVACYGPQAPAPTAYPLAPGRGLPYINEPLIAHYELVLRVAGFDPRTPVLLDRAGRILDGYHRLMAADRLGVRAYFVQLDY